MASWAALNTDAPRVPAEATGDFASEEALEAHNVALYERALRLQQQNELEDAKAIYSDLLQTEAGLSSRLRYLCAKNLASLEADRHQYATALRHFSEALALDDSDVLVWYQMGKAAVETGQLWLARRAFECGYQADATFWPLVHALVDVLGVIGDKGALNRMKQYISDHDPYAVFDVEMDGDDTRAKRRTRAQECAVEASKKRKLLLEDGRRLRSDAQEKEPLEYLLQEDSWQSLGKLLLGAYEDAYNEATGEARKIVVRVDLPDEDEDMPTLPDASASHTTNSPAPSTPAIVDLTAESEAPPSKAHSPDGTGSASVPIDVDDENSQVEIGAAQATNRRKSRRHEEKLREEHENAAKLAREKNLTFRLRSFLLATADTQDSEDRQLKPLCFSVHDGSVILTRSSESEPVHEFPSVLPRPPPSLSQASTSLTRLDDQASADRTSAANATHRVGRRDIIAFVERVFGAESSSAGCDVTLALQQYVNQCGEWSDRLMRGSSEHDDLDIHQVCLWAEKVIRGRLNNAVEPATNTKTAIGLARTPRTSLTLDAQLFLLELQVDEFKRRYPQDRKSQRNRAARRAFKEQAQGLYSAIDSLLLAFCLSAGSEDIVDDEGESREEAAEGAFLSRLFWLAGQVSEHQSDANAAKTSYSKCRDALGRGGSTQELHRPNVRGVQTLSIALVDKKIQDLQYTDVCTDARQSIARAQYEDAEDKLLLHFFISGDTQKSRVGELIEDLARYRQKDTEGDGEDDEEDDRSLLDLLLQSIVQSETPAARKMIVMLVVLDELIKFTIECRDGYMASTPTEPKATMTKRLMTSLEAVRMTLQYLQTVTAVSEEIDLATGEAIVTVTSKLVDANVLLHFETPAETFHIILDIVDAIAHPEVHAALLRSVLQSFLMIRSLPAPELHKILELVSPAHTSNKSKKKQTSRSERARVYLQSALSYVARNATVLVSAVPSAQVRAVMEDMCVMLKDEEDTVTNSRHRSDTDKSAAALFTVGAVLFLRIFVTLASSDQQPQSFVGQLIGLVALLHERLGQHELCTSPISARPSQKTSKNVGESFVDVASSYLSEYRQTADSLRVKTTTRATATDNGDGTMGGDGYDATMAQCFRCSYDAQVLPGTVDHKTGLTISRLVDWPVQSIRAARAHQLATFTIPLMLDNKPTSNAQKKEYLKVLHTLKDALSLEEIATSPVSPSQDLLLYLEPEGLGRREDPVVPVLPEASSSRVECLDHVWFLLGENFILNRARRRSNFNELIEMERKLKERVGLLFRDVHHYRPRRVESWVRLGRALKELHQLTSDVCALLLPRHFKSRAFKNFIEDTAGAGGNADRKFKFVALSTSVFEKLKEWKDAPTKDGYYVRLGATTKVDDDTNALDNDILFEEFIASYLMQAVELSRRCFAMATSLVTCEIVDDAELNDVTKERVAIAVECYEESGLMLYGVLQEFSNSFDRLEIESAQGSVRGFYQVVLQLSQLDFERALALSVAHHPDAHDMRFRLQYMLGKIKRKQFHVLRDNAVRMEDVLRYFASAEQSHEDGKLDKSIVHAFYQLQARRLELVLDHPATIKNLSLACEHYFEEEPDESDGENDARAAQGADSKLGDRDVKMEEKEEPEEVKVGKAEVAAILVMAADAGSADLQQSYVDLAQAWLYLNVLEALESISDEDRYFHCSRYAIANAVVRFDGIIDRLRQISDAPIASDIVATPVRCLKALLETKKKKRSLEENASPHQFAIQEMHVLFDKRRPQIVAIWLSEHVPVAKKFEELNQRQIKFDVWRLKYWSFYVSLLEQSKGYARLKEIGSWVQACKEEHGVVDEMLGVLLHARGRVQLARLNDYVSTDLVLQLERARSRSEAATTEEAGPAAEEDPSDALLKELGKSYVNYLDVVEARARLEAVMDADAFTETKLMAEFPVVHLFAIGVTEFPATFELLSEMTSSSYVVDVVAKLKLLLEEWTQDAIPANFIVAVSAIEWQPLVDTARIFCEDRWPERHANKAGPKISRKPRQQKAVTNSAATPVVPETVDLMETTGEREDPIVISSVESASVANEV